MRRAGRWFSSWCGQTLRAPMRSRRARFVQRFRDAYGGEEPAAADALAFDAVEALRAALAKLPSGSGRAGLARLIAGGGQTGVTGKLAFGPTGERAGEPQLYFVDKD